MTPPPAISRAWVGAPSRVLVGALIGALAGHAAADSVTLRAASPNAPQYSLSGAIVDWTGDAIRLRVGRGAERSYPTERVVEVQTLWPEAAADAEAAMDRREWGVAAGGFASAERQEQRGWARRRLAIRRLECLLAGRRWVAAGDLLLAIDASDPSTRAWRLAPLPWFPSDAVPPGDADRWLGSGNQAGRLLGAAWRLRSPRGDEAIAELRRLARSRRPAIATLAETQLWRRDLVTADRALTDRWSRRLESIPAHLAPGPRHLLAQAYQRQKRYDAATLAALRDPLVGAAPHRLAARGLGLAARCLRQAGREAEAARLAEELARDYPDAAP